MKLKVDLAARLLCLSAIFLSLAACSPAPTPTPAPTQDPAEQVRQVVETAFAQMTAEALRNPSATPTQTATLPPTPTPEPSATPTLTLTPTPAVTDTPQPTATFTALPLAAQALYATTFPGNRREYAGNEGFGLALGFQNIGSVTWEPGYYVKMVGFEGEATVQQEVSTDQAVLPGGKIEFNLWAFGSETPGRHVWYFQLYTPAGAAVPGGYISFSYVSNTPADQ